jgi:hypothetical protein
VPWVIRNLQTQVLGGGESIGGNQLPEMELFPNYANCADIAFKDTKAEKTQAFQVLRDFGDR